MHEKKLFARGSYIILCNLAGKIKAKIGSLGIHELEAGDYIYVGSALGPGGIYSRICRHIKKKKKIWWHIDYLTVLPECTIKLAIIIPSSERFECIISSKLYEEGFKAPIHKFGSMDCKCYSHFFHISSLSNLVDLLSSLGIEFYIINRNELDSICSRKIL